MTGSGNVPGRKRRTRPTRAMTGALETSLGRDARILTPAPDDPPARSVPGADGSETRTCGMAVPDETGIPAPVRPPDVGAQGGKRKTGREFEIFIRIAPASGAKLAGRKSANSGVVPAQSPQRPTPVRAPRGPITRPARHIPSRVRLAALPERSCAGVTRYAAMPAVPRRLARGCYTRAPSRTAGRRRFPPAQHI